VTYWGREIVERGLPVKWFEEAKRSNVRHSILPEEEDKLVVLKLAHFEESFRVLLGGVRAWSCCATPGVRLPLVGEDGVGAEGPRQLGVLGRAAEASQDDEESWLSLRVHLDSRFSIDGTIFLIANTTV
jgi:hypothetical protein